MTGPPAEVVALAERRAAARAARDFATSDALRDEIARAGWLVKDTADGYALTAKPPYDLYERVGDLPDRSAEPDIREVTVAILAEGWPDDVRRCVTSVRAHSDAHVLVLDCGIGYTDDAAEVLHLAGNPGWAAARTALLKADTARIHLTLDPSIELTGDAVMPVVRAFDDPAVVVAGGWGVSADADWRGFSDAPPGEVDALLGYLFAVRRSAGLATPPDPKARFYRNADLEWSFLLRAAGGKAVATAPLPATRHRHRGYHDSDPDYRDRESRRTYDRLLKRFRPGP